jgi:hypothetical protein
LRILLLLLLIKFKKTCGEELFENTKAMELEKKYRP